MTFRFSERLNRLHPVARLHRVLLPPVAVIRRGWRAAPPWLRIGAPSALLAALIFSVLWLTWRPTAPPVPPPEPTPTATEAILAEVTPTATPTPEADPTPTATPTPEAEPTPPLALDDVLPALSADRLDPKHRLPPGLYSQSACSRQARQKVLEQDVWRGAHCRMFWASLMPAPGEINFSIMDEYIESLRAGGKHPIVGSLPRADFGFEPDAPGMLGAPLWMLGPEYNPIPGGKDDLGQINYANPNVRAAYAEWVEQVVAYYSDRADMAFEIGFGHQGEFRPVATRNARDRQAYIDAWGGEREASDQWRDWGFFVVKAWADAMERYDAQFAAYAIITGQFIRVQERSEAFIHEPQCSDCNLIEYAVSRGIGLKSTGLTGDTLQYNARIAANGGHDDNAWQLSLLNNSSEVLIVGENGAAGGTEDFDARMRSPLSFYWGMLKCLDLRCDQLHLPGGRPGSAHEWYPSDHEEALDFFYQHVGKSAAESPSAWTVLRTTDDHQQQWCREGNCDTHDFRFYLELIEDAPEGQLAPEFSSGPNAADSRIRELNDTDVRSRFVKRTRVDEGVRYAYFRLDPDFAASLTGPITVTVTYLDVGFSPDDGFELFYLPGGEDDSSRSAGRVRKSMDGPTYRTWQKAHFVLEEYRFSVWTDRYLPHDSDFFIDAGAEGDLWLHMVQVERGSLEAAGAPAPTPQRVSRLLPERRAY